MSKVMYNGQVISGSVNHQIVSLTRAEYDALPESKLNNDVIYEITDEGFLPTEAFGVQYDDTNTQFGVDNVQDAVEKVIDEFGEVKDEVYEINENLANTKSYIFKVITIGDVTLTANQANNINISTKVNDNKPEGYTPAWVKLKAFWPRSTWSNASVFETVQTGTSALVLSTLVTQAYQIQVIVCYVKSN